MSILASVTELEDRVVETVRTLQEPVVDYVRKGVERAEGRMPRITYPAGLPKPGEFVESQFAFAKALLETQKDFVSELVDAVAPLVTPAADSAPQEPAATEAKAEPKPKTSAKSSAKKPGTAKA